jgi:hypothetical protein
MNNRKQTALFLLMFRIKEQTPPPPHTHKTSFPQIALSHGTPACGVNARIDAWFMQRSSRAGIQRRSGVQNKVETINVFAVDPAKLYTILLASE